MELFEQPNADNKTIGEPNLYIGSCTIRAEHLEGGVIHQGDDINIRWRIDESGLINAAVHIPCLAKTFDSENFYAPVTAVRNRVFGGEGGERLVSGMLSRRKQEQKVEIRKLENEIAPVEKEGANNFRFLVVDSDDNPVEDANKEITITRTAASVDAISAMHAVAVKIAKGDGKQATLSIIVEKGSTLPAEGVAEYRAAKDVGGEDGESQFSVELFEQPNADNKTIGEPNLYIGSCTIRAEHLEGGVIHQGDDINIRWRIDESGLINAAVHIPCLAKTFDSENFYAPVTAVRNRVFGGEGGERLVSGMLSAAQKDAKDAREIAGEEQKVEIRKLENEIAKQKADLKSDNDAEAQQSVENKVREIRQRLFAVRNDPQNSARALKHRLEEIKEFFDGSREDADEEKVGRFDELAQHAKEAVDKNDEDAEKILEEMEGIAMQVFYSRPAVVAGLFRNLASEPQAAIDKDLFEEHVKQGMAAVENEDMNALRGIISEMFSNQADAGSGLQEKEMRLAADIMRK